MEVDTKHKHIAQFSGLHFKDYVGYALGDVGCCLVYSLTTSLLQRFYTDVLFLNPIFIMVMFIIARIWDAINDPIMGRICDKTKPNKSGKFKRWFIYGGLPLMVASILMFIKMPTVIGTDNWNTFIGAYVFATITYVLFGMTYTMVQIPYGGLASVVTLDLKERNKLSVYRSIGSCFGSLPVILLNSLAFYNNSTGKHVNYITIIIGVSIMAMFSFVAMFGAYKLNKERVAPKPVEYKKGAMKRSIRNVFKNRTMIVLCIIGMLLLTQATFGSSYHPYLISCYYNIEGFIGQIPSLLQIVSQFALMFFVPKLAIKYGKKEICVVGCIIAFVATFASFFLVFVPGTMTSKGTIDHSNTLPAFLTLYGIGQLGIGILNVQTWGMVADGIDAMEVQNGYREDGTTFAFFMIFRKFGAIISVVAVNISLLVMNYNFVKPDFTINQLRLMFYLASLIPTAILGVIVYLMVFLYPLNKKRLLELQDEKEAMLIREEKASIKKK